MAACGQCTPLIKETCFQSCRIQNSDMPRANWGWMPSAAAGRKVGQDDMLIELFPREKTTVPSKQLQDGRFKANQSNPKPGHTTGRSNRSGARRGGEVGRGWLGQDAVESIWPGDYPPSFPTANRRHCPGRFFESTNKRNPIQTVGGTKLEERNQRLTSG